MAQPLPFMDGESTAQRVGKVCSNQQVGIKVSAPSPSLAGLPEPFVFSPSTKVYYYFRLMNTFPFALFHVPKNRDLFTEMLKLLPGTVVPNSKNNWKPPNSESLYPWSIRLNKSTDLRLWPGTVKQGL